MEAASGAKLWRVSHDRVEGLLLELEECGARHVGNGSTRSRPHTHCTMHTLVAGYMTFLNMI